MDQLPNLHVDFVLAVVVWAVHFPEVIDILVNQVFVNVRNLRLRKKKRVPMLLGVLVKLFDRLFEVLPGFFLVVLRDLTHGRSSGDGLLYIKLHLVVVHMGAVLRLLLQVTFQAVLN